MFTLAQQVEGSTLTLHNMEFCLWRTVVRCTPSDWTEGPPLIGMCHQRLPTQYICNNPPYREVSSSAHTLHTMQWGQGTLL